MVASNGDGDGDGDEDDGSNDNKDKARKVACWVDKGSSPRLSRRGG